MKRFFICVLILTLFFFAIFFVGWSQFRVKSGMTGVVVSKTGGINEKPVVNGVFSWNKEFLLPSNANLLLFSIEPLTVTKNIRGSLPSSQFYELLGKDYDFSYNFNFEICITISPEGIVQLLKENVISSEESLKDYMQTSASLIAERASDYYLKKAVSSKSFRPEQVRREDLYRSLKLYEECPWIELSLFSVLDYEVPDFELYEKVRSNYFSKEKSKENFNENLNSIESSDEDFIENLVSGA